MSCGSCMLGNSFGKRGNSNAKKAMRLSHKKNISLKKAWKIVKKSHKVSRKTKRHGSKKSKRRGSKKSKKRASKRRSGRKGRKGRKFGMVAGPGFQAQTSYQNNYAPYFGAAESFINPSEWYLPQTGGAIQSPQMQMAKPY